MVPRYFAVLLFSIALDVAPGPSPDGCSCNDDDEVEVGIDSADDDTMPAVEDERHEQDTVDPMSKNVDTTPRVSEKK